MTEDCKHKRTRRNYPFGKKSKPIIKCKDCGKIISNKELAEKRKRKLKYQNKIKNSKRNY